MKVIATEQGKLLDLVPLEEIRPDSGIYLPAFSKAVAARYGFAASSQDLAAAITQGLKFEHGHVSVQGADILIKELGVYSDGLIVDCLDSRMSDMVLEDFLNWATKEFRLRERRSPIRRSYTSALTVEFDKQIEPALGIFTRMANLLAETIRAAYGYDYVYNLQRIALAADPAVVPAMRPTMFYIERRNQVSYSANRYYSGAPLPTDRLIELLETIERELLGD